MKLEFDSKTRRQLAEILKNASRMVRDGTIGDPYQLGIVAQTLHECIRGGFGRESSQYDDWNQGCCDPLVEPYEGDMDITVVRDDEATIKNTVFANCLLIGTGLGVCSDGLIRDISEVEWRKAKQENDELEDDEEEAETELDDSEMELATETA